jgi:hypothetical protein
VILGMLAHGIPLTLLPDLVWPCALEHDVAGPSGRHRRDPAAPPRTPDEQADGPGARTDFSGGPVAC